MSRQAYRLTVAALAPECAADAELVAKIETHIEGSAARSLGVQRDLERVISIALARAPLEGFALSFAVTVELLEHSP